MVQDKTELKNDLYNAFYWYYRHLYGEVIGYAEEENQVILSTKKAEEYVDLQIYNLINQLKRKNGD